MWRKLPIWLRAILLGILVAGVPTIIWALLAATNLKLTPTVPWSVPAMAGVLWLYWRYLRGEGPQPRLAAYRKEHLRAIELTPHVWRWALLAGGSAIAAVWALFAALRGLMHMANPANDLARIPMGTILAAIVMGSAVAGVAEEAGFRGFMQLPLERAYGPVIALATTSVVFTLIHLTHGAAILPFLPFYLVVAVVYGLLTLLTGSILPSMTLHFIGDVMMISLQYIAAREGAVTAATGTIAMRPAIAFLVLAALSVIAFRLLAREAPTDSMSGILRPTAT
jgi:membrane protease YdiL (CAAX protease family)